MKTNPSNPYQLEIETIRLGRDVLLKITGGVAHIGAAATAYQMEDETKVATHVVPGHREGELAAQIAARFAQVLQRTVTVVMGIHIDHATKEDIRLIVETVEKMAEQELHLLKASLQPGK